MYKQVLFHVMLLYFRAISQAAGKNMALEDENNAQ